MIIEKNGIKIDASVRGNVLTYKILKQTKKASKFIKLFGVLQDNETGFSLRINNKPSFNSNIKRFFLRGKDSDKDEAVVTHTFGSTAEATQAMNALDKLIGKITRPQALVLGAENIRYDKGGTSAVRFALITHDLAKKLHLTGKEYFPDELFWKEAEPTVTSSRHFNERIAQAVDVLNKAHNFDGGKGNVIHPEKVSPEQAKKAVEAIRKLIVKADKDDYLVALWRLFGGIRGPDHEDVIDMSDLDMVETT